MPVDTGAGRTRIETGTPLCRPTPLASTGRWIVVSKRTGALLAGRHFWHELSIIAIPKPNCNMMIINDALKLTEAKTLHIDCQLWRKCRYPLHRIVTGYMMESSCPILACS